ncbi:TetR/AcrR family transcriptional regulator C-terminal domain-containing protein [Kineosporia sp. J2-2]|uniref:TetR/AcrR family transcriptional regulator C-terminal domain-containing protein n=1 Tax=Kineosporia corallincola TaxID=2835133 RepID=A0ABS5TQR6_9ACTN|nr:TetR/AcrR family transcriptional regulator C-terminal domain-containing protein [Kineosporia corallincola]MBT0772706.1 TetR/AcrR family transcriptional regulator C-terminal domain-containing protein [Kineosporia corallincola]
MPEPDLPIWKRSERGARGPAPEHSRASIAAAAIGLADAEGLKAVSIRRVASAVGSAPASLYRYLASRDELLALMADAAIGTLELPATPTGQGWRHDVLTIARLLRQAYREHPWLLELVMSGRLNTAMLGPSTIDYTERVVAALAELPAPGRAKMEAAAIFNGVVGLFAMDEASAHNSTSPQAQVANAAYLAERIGDGEHPYLAAILASPPPPDAVARKSADDLFGRVVVSIMSGLLGVTPEPD